MYYVGVDVGGQTIKTGVVTETGELQGELTIVPTESEKGNEHFLEQLCQSIRLAMKSAQVELD
ncbi:MAG TPA: ROK family protein, partial [Gemmatales bacterium]|nr:ROK family protein [Gemmatales bacterium]